MKKLSGTEPKYEDRIVEDVTNILIKKGKDGKFLAGQVLQTSFSEIRRNSGFQTLCRLQQRVWKPG